MSLIVTMRTQLRARLMASIRRKKQVIDADFDIFFQFVLLIQTILSILEVVNSTNKSNISL